MSNMSVTPWYRQFWPWFLIILPASVVVAGITTVFIAINNADTLVNDNYYRDGLAINRTLDQDIQAGQLALSAALNFDLKTGEVQVALIGDYAASNNLDLLLLHPVDASKDQHLVMVYSGQGRYRGDLNAVPENRYYLRLESRLKPLWRLNGEIDFASQQAISLHANP